MTIDFETAGGPVRSIRAGRDGSELRARADDSGFGIVSPPIPNSRVNESGT